MTSMPTHHRSRRSRGFGAIAAVVMVVVLAALGAGIARLSWTSTVASGQDVMVANARMAARAGIEWGLYQVLRGSWSGCTSSTQTLDLRSSDGMWVTVTCTGQSTPYVEGADASATARTVRIYAIDAVACNGTATCPDNTAATRLGYVERRQRTSVSDVNTLP